MTLCHAPFSHVYSGDPKVCAAKAFASSPRFCSAVGNDYEPATDGQSVAHRHQARPAARRLTLGSGATMHRAQLRSGLERVLEAPVSAWVMLAFFIAYLLFFIGPVFFSSGRMQQVPDLPAAMNHIGNDLMLMLSYSASWFVGKSTPYIGLNLYPPVAAVVFTPLTFVEFASAYRIITLLSVSCYAGLVFFLPWLATMRRSITAVQILIFTTGLLSYGLQFELERGQFNIIAVTLCFFAIWLFHYNSQHRWLAYTLFILSVQLKLYPFIFIVMFIDDWEAGRSNFVRIAALTLGCFLCFLVMGPKIAVDFAHRALGQSAAPPLWVFNHSIRAFVGMASESAIQHGWPWLSEYSGWLEAALLVFVGACLVIVTGRAYQRRSRGLNAPLLLACTAAALLLPPVSWDYTLPALSAPVAILLVNSSLSRRELGHSPSRDIGFVVGIVCLSGAYASTLFSSTHKGHSLLFQNNLPALCVMLLAVTCLELWYAGRLQGLIPRT